MVEDSYDLTKRKDERSGEYVPEDIPAERAADEVLKKVPGAESRKRKDGRVELNVPSTSIRSVMSEFRRMGYDHFVALTCIDLIKEDMFEMVYHLWSYGARTHVYVKTNIPREDPSIESVVEVFRTAVTYEREIKEMFGVDFPGNQRLTQFILEDWEGPPPMRKDFDSIRYVQDKFDIKVRNPKGLPPKWTKEGGK